MGPGLACLLGILPVNFKAHKFFEASFACRTFSIQGPLKDEEDCSEVKEFGLDWNWYTYLEFPALPQTSCSKSDGPSYSEAFRPLKSHGNQGHSCNVGCLHSFPVLALSIAILQFSMHNKIALPNFIELIWE